MWAIAVRAGGKHFPLRGRIHRYPRLRHLARDKEAMSLFDDAGQKAEPPSPPLAERLRPTSLAEVSGQEHLTGPDGALTRLLQSPTLGSLIFWGPPGSGGLERALAP